ncbi:MAG TPA: CmcI family methyltransferase, partial [Pirellulales bacterium]
MLTVDFEAGLVRVREDGAEREYPLASQQAFAALSRAWLRCGWDTKYVYSFSWFGRPIIQLPEDLIRIQEVIYRVQPDVIIETGIAHGGSLVFYASLCKAMGRGRVIGI